ncbi:hypothetical protein COU80_00075 [Candidatus Peregrinibacteria bacterium CG10_big_fil_rev_8_21_14_0_10_55_24]|nr:MAG: hypothetical protein COU80_00075 [Candidatus Peregrinibacteria bacterium CG10_big_fil_rev_8_21_14_0_10_55_24]
MTHTKKQVLLTVLAVVLVVESFALWTGIVSWHVLRGELTSIEEYMFVAVAPPMFTEEDPVDAVHSAAQEDVQEIPSFVVPKVDLAQEKVVDATQKEERAPAEDVPKSDLERWGIEPWLTLSIPSLDITAPVWLPSRIYWDAHDWAMLEEQMQVGLLHGATAYPHSSAPGRSGSLIIAGHSSPPDERAQDSLYGALFAQLPTIDRGAEIIVTARGQSVRYRVRSTDVVPKTATDILHQEYEERTLKIITCFPVGSTRDRFVVLADLIED